MLACARSAGVFEGSLRRIVHALKFRGHRSLARPLGRRMCEAGSDVLRGADAVVPVPLHWRRQRERGFNQADDLARALGLPVARVLERRRLTAPQSGLPAARRHLNVRDAFAVRGTATRALVARWAPALGRPAGAGWSRVKDRIVGRCLVLVDDVATTGATLEACARVLLDAGAREVRAVTAARAVTGRS